MSAEDIPGLQEWLMKVAEELGLPEQLVFPDPLLEVAHDVAHEVIRPGAPTSTYLIGAALGLELGRRAGLREAAVSGGDSSPAGPDAEEVRELLRGLARRVRGLAAAEGEIPGPGTR